MSDLFVLLATSFALGLALTPVARTVALRVGLVDRPDGRRKIHGRHVPQAGGLAVLVAATLALVAAASLLPGVATILAADHFRLAGLFLAALVVCAVGLADDLHYLRGRHKLFGQVFAVGIVMSSGVVVERVHLFGWPLELGLLALPFTGFFLLGAINSLNLIDGMDGLLGCVGAIVCLALAVMAVAAGRLEAALVAAALGGALLAFLCFNLPPASVFMGDCGSMLVGLVVGVLAITSSLKGPATVALLAPLTVLVIPIFDTTAAIIRRKLTGRSVYTTDRGHIHHCLLRSGLSVSRVLLVVSGLCLVAGGGVLASLVWQNELLALLAATTVVLILVVGRLFGHAEVALVQQRFLSLWASLRGRKAHALAVRLQGSAEWNALWETLIASAAEMDLQTLHLDLNVPALHEGYHARWDRFGVESEVPCAWRAEIPLVVGGQIAGRLVVTGPRGDTAIGDHMAVVARLAAEVERAVEHVTELLRQTLVALPTPVEAGAPVASRGSLSIDRAVG